MLAGVEEGWILHTHDERVEKLLEDSFLPSHLRFIFKDMNGMKLLRSLWMEYGMG